MKHPALFSGKTISYKNLKCVCGVDRKICPEGHCLAAQGLPGKLKRKRDGCDRQKLNFLSNNYC